VYKKSVIKKYKERIYNMQSKIEDVKFLEFPQHGDERGRMVIVEGDQDVPFNIARLFYIYGSDSSVVRGCHANRKSKETLI
jgi:dTDP-4-dehydrorhamnose 3,5-epimerase-like enzyme